MATIDKLDIGVYIWYARQTEMLEEINRQYRLDEAASIPPQTQMVDFFPKPSELQLLLGFAPAQMPWAYFFPPKNFQKRRRSPFAFSRIAPSLGSTDEQLEDAEKVQATECHNAEEESEKAAISSCLKQIEKINEWLSFIIGRIGQFLQG